MTETTRPLSSGVPFTDAQMETIRRALADADALQTESIDGWCADCERDPAALCDDHAAARIWRQQYRDLRREMEPHGDRDLEAEAYGTYVRPQPEEDLSQQIEREAG